MIHANVYTTIILKVGESIEKRFPEVEFMANALFTNTRHPSSSPKIQLGCLSVTQHLTSRMLFRLTNDTSYTC